MLPYLRIAALLQESLALWGVAGEATAQAEAVRQGYDAALVRQFFSGVRQDPAVIRADRSQGIFQRPFTDFSRRLISQNRIDNGRRNAQRYDAVFDRVQRDYGVSPGILNSGSVSLAAPAVFAAEVNGTTPGTQHDQLNVTGTVALGNATLALTSTGYTPALGDTIVLISNDGTDAVTGTFNIREFKGPEGQHLAIYQIAGESVK